MHARILSGPVHQHSDISLVALEPKGASSVPVSTISFVPCHLLTPVGVLSVVILTSTVKKPLDGVSS